MNDQHPLVIRGQGDYVREYWGGEAPKAKPDPTGAVVRERVALVQRKAGVLFGRAGYIGHALQYSGSRSAIDELQRLAIVHDELGKLIAECGEQLNQEANR